ncbi:MAG: tetratricopeptide repeat protein [Rhodospirillaceae bacterium]|nr:tetratricopeptide repeat protein [Rhodospirillaceae bacterium]
MRELLSIGLENHRHGRIEQAAAAYERVIEADPGNPDANHLLGIVAHQMGRDDLSVELITTAIGTNPGIADYHCNLGNALRGLTRNDEAADAYRIALKLTPDDPEIHSNLGNALRDLGRHDESMTAYGQALALNPEFAEAHNNLGTVQQELGKLNDATASFDEAIRLNPEFPEALNNLGDIWQAKGEPGKAETCFRRALAARADYAEAHNNLGTVLQGAAKPDEALTHYRRAVELKPDFHQALYNLGYLLEDHGKSREAFECYQDAFAARTGLESEKRADLAPGTVSLFLELTNKCNFHCEFCPSDIQERAAGFMDMDLATRMYNEVAEKGLATQVMLHLMGEPTLHPKLYEILAYGKSKGIRTELVTNGSALVAKTVPKLLNNLHGTVIASLMTPTRESYVTRGDVGLKWDRYIDNFRLLIREHLTRLARGEPTQYEITMRVMVTKDSKGRVNILESVDDIRDNWDEWCSLTAEIEKELGLEPFPRPDVDPDRVLSAAGDGTHSKYLLQRGHALSFWSAFTFANTRVGDDYELKTQEEEVERFCKHPFLDVGVLWNGDVTMCCMDYDAQLTVGNVNDTTLEAVMTSDAAADLRESMYSLHTLPEFCRQCQARPVLPGEDVSDAGPASSDQRAH